MDALKAKFPAPVIAKWTREKEGGISMYDIEFKQDGQKFEADVKEEGIIDNWEKAIPVNELPHAARMTVDKKYPKSAIKEVMQTVSISNGKDVPEGYEITLVTSGNKAAEITVAADGKVLEESAGKQ
jgi:hypothetical protein